jgi:hypothetical protein
MKNQNTFDKFLALVFAIMTVAFVVFAMSNTAFFVWAFERHQNQLSWYIRPLSLIPFCYFAYKRSWSGIFGTIFLLMTSMFWFPKPESVSPQVVEFLEMEKAYLTGEWNLAKVLIALLIPLSLGALAAAFWKRSLRVGLGLVAGMAILKGIWSLVVTGEAGKSTLGPVIVGILICALIYFGYRRMQSRKNSQ